ncbi:MAG: glycosyltransferase family 9 protein [Bdellovibrionota bacterium]
MSPKPSAPTQILLIRLSSLGDLVLCTSVLAPLERAGYRVSLVTKSEFAPLFRSQPGIDEVFAFDKKKGEAVAREELYAWAAERHFALVLDLQNSWRTWSWRGQLRRLAPVRALRKPRLREWLVIFLRLGPLAGLGRGGRARRFRDFTLQALRSLGVPFPPEGTALTRLESPAAERAEVRALLPPGDFVVLLPGGAWKSKEWPYFPELARRFGRRVPVVVLGGSKDSVCEEVAAAAREHNSDSLSLHGRTSLRQSMAILAEARWVVGNDTGMVHVAEALGKGVAMIEGPTHSSLGFSPYRENSVALGLPLICRPCSKSGRVCVRFGTRLCLNGLSPDAVAARLRQGGYPC